MHGTLRTSLAVKKNFLLVLHEEPFISTVLELFCCGDVFSSEDWQFYEWSFVYALRISFQVTVMHFPVCHHFSNVFLLSFIVMKKILVLYKAFLAECFSYLLWHPNAAYKADESLLK